MDETRKEEEQVVYRPIGIIRTPYRDWAPHQPVERETDKEAFRLVLHPGLEKGLRDLDRFRYIYVLFHMDRVSQEPSMTVAPPWAKGKTVGLFAARTPVRPNPIGLSIVKIKGIEGCEIVISPIDALDGSPLLDVKPYFRGLDAKEDADLGWVHDLEDPDHLMQHLRGLAHHHHHHHHE